MQQHLKSVIFDAFVLSASSVIFDALVVSASSVIFDAFVISASVLTDSDATTSEICYL